MKTNLLKSAAALAVIIGSLASAPMSGAAGETPSALDLARQLNQAFIQVADKVSPSVVVVRVARKPDYTPTNGDEGRFFDTLPPELQRWFEERFEAPPRREAPRRNREPVFDGQGSGVVIREEGFILTNHHVVEGADKIKVRFKDGTEYDAVVRGEDPRSDLAVLKIEAKGLPAAKLADSSRVRVGEFAIAIGAPFNLDYSVTIGHISAKGRHVIPSYAGGAALDQDFIQTDANINPGNSGGPLLNIDGEVIGINAMIRGLRSGIGFAIPSNLAREIADKLIADGKVVRSWLGVGIASLRDFTEYRDTLKGLKDGVVIRTIEPDGPAAKSELKPSDVITAVDGKPVVTAQELKDEIRSKTVGGSVTLDVVRNGKSLKVKVRTEQWPGENIPVANRYQDRRDSGTASFGLTVRSLTRDLARQYDLEVTEGVIVTSVEPDSVAARKGFKPGDVITEVNHEKVTTPAEFREALEGKDPKKGVVINLVSGGTSKFEILKDSGD